MHAGERGAFAEATRAGEHLGAAEIERGLLPFGAPADPLRGLPARQGLRLRAPTVLGGDDLFVGWAREGGAFQGRPTLHPIRLPDTA